MIAVLARGGNGALHTKYYSGGARGAWTSLGRQLLAGTSPVAYSWGSERTSWFVIGTNHALHHSWTGSSG